MKGLNKRILSRVLLLVFVCQLFATSAFAAVDSNSIVNEVAYALDYIDTKNESAINSAYNALTGLEATAETEAAISGLLTTNFTSKFAQTNIAKNALVNILSESLAVYFTTKSDELGDALVAADEAIVDDFAIAFGLDDTTKWFDLFLLTRRDAQKFAEEGLGIRRIWALKGKSELFEVMDEVHIDAVNARLGMAGYEDIKAAMENLGWTAENLTSALRGISNLADESNVGEYALLKAAARSSIKVMDGSSDITPVLAGKDYIANAEKYTPDSVPGVESFKVNVVLDTWNPEPDAVNVSNILGYVSTNEDVVRITPTENEDGGFFSVEYTGERGTADIILYRDPIDGSGTTNDWLVRWRVSVLNNIA